MRVYIFSPIPYSFLHQRPQKIADSFRARSIPVTYLEPCGFTEYLAGRKKGIVRLIVSSLGYHVLGILALVFPWLGRKRVNTFRRSAKQPDFLNISMPLVVPSNRFDSPILERLNASIYRQVLRRKVFRDMKEDEDVAIVQNPFWGAVLKTGDFHTICYDCIDEISLFSGRSSPERFAGYERELLDLSDAVFVTARQLEEHVHSVRPDVPLHRIANGVDYDWFQERVRQGDTMSDLANVRRPIIGYAGILRSWMDYDLIGMVADTFTHASVVFVGPLDYAYRIESLRSRANIFWLGRKEYRDVPCYINAFDVCVIPFLAGKIAQTTNPVKLYEYFALGKPVVSSWLAELEPYRDDGLVYMGATREEFLAGVRAALAEEDPGARKKRMSIAGQHTWSGVVDRMLSAVGGEG